MPRRCVRAVLAAAISLVVSVALAGPAAAKVWVEVTPTAAAPGATVRAQLMVHGSSPSTSSPLTLYVAPLSVAEAVTSASDPRLVRLGTLRADAGGLPTLIFRVPNLDAGSYALILDVPPGAASFGPYFGWAGEFQVMNGPPVAALPDSAAAPAPNPDRGGPSLLLAFLALGAAALAAALLVGRGTQRRGTWRRGT